MHHPALKCSKTISAQNWFSTPHIDIQKMPQPAFARDALCVWCGRGEDAISGRFPYDGCC